MIKFDLNNFINSSLRFKNSNEFSKYLESCYIEIETYFTNITNNELDKIKFDLDDFFCDLIDMNLVQQNNNNIIEAFLLLTAEQFERANLIGSMTDIFTYIPESSVKIRLQASKLYIKVNDLRKDYHVRFDTIMELILKSNNNDEYYKKTLNAIIRYFITALKEFTRVNDKSLASSFTALFKINQTKYHILQDKFIVDIISSINIDNFSIEEQNILSKLDKLLINHSYNNKIKSIQIEQSDYASLLHNLNDPTIEDIKQVSYKYIKDIGDSTDLHTQLNNGTTIINQTNLLYKYFASYSKMHKYKLDEAFETIVNKLDNKTINIIDWGCGQALATISLIEYIKTNNLKIKLNSIKLIEPSKLAIERGLLHIDLLKQEPYQVESINKDIDCIDNDDIRFKDNNIVLHLFSNILDIETFKLNNNFLNIISNTFNSDNYFICVSPNINAKRNGRLELFYKYFDDNFNTDLVSSRDNNIDKYTRYEKVFKVNYIVKKIVEKVREDFKEETNSFHLNIYTKLEKYQLIIEPTLQLSKLKENIEQDPDYVIFKIRKLAEIITSHIYAQYESNEHRVSQNDKIRYLSFEKNILSRKSQSHLNTIRTIGNIGTHEHINNPAKMLKDDAYFLATALLLLIEELVSAKIIEI